MSFLKAERVGGAVCSGLDWLGAPKGCRKAPAGAENDNVHPVSGGRCTKTALDFSGGREPYSLLAWATGQESAPGQAQPPPLLSPEALPLDLAGVPLQLLFL